MAFIKWFQQYIYSVLKIVTLFKNVVLLNTHFLKKLNLCYMPFNIYNLNTLLKYILSKTFKFLTFLRLCKQFLNYSIERGVLKFVTLALFDV